MLGWTEPLGTVYYGFCLLSHFSARKDLTKNVLSLASLLCFAQRYQSSLPYQGLYSRQTKPLLSLFSAHN